VVEPAHATFGQEVKRMKEEEDREAAISEMDDRLSRFCRMADRDMGCMGYVSKHIVRAGEPVEELLRVAEEESCDIFVLGSHGKGFLKQALLGSVSRKVLDRAARPVVIIPLLVDLSWNKFL